MLIYVKNGRDISGVYCISGVYWWHNMCYLGLEWFVLFFGCRKFSSCSLGAAFEAVEYKEGCFKFPLMAAVELFLAVFSIKLIIDR